MAIASLDEETAKKVIRQVEFYFSDSNLPRDKFLSNTVSENQDGLVSLALICSFSRMRNHLGLGDAKPEDVSEDTVKAVAETLKTSSFLKVSEDGTKIGRATELPKPEEVIEQLDVRTVAALPLSYDAKLEDVESFFGQFAKVNSVRLPRHVADKRLFCGTALIEFSSEEDATKVLKETMVYAGVELELKPKKDFDSERAKQEEEVKISRSQKGSNHKNSSNAEDNYPKGLIVAFKLETITAGDSAVKKGDQGPVKDNGDACNTDAEQGSTDMVTEEVKVDEQKPAENTEKESKEKFDEKNTEKESKEKVDEKNTENESLEKVDEKTTLESEEIEGIEKEEAKETVEKNSAMEMYKDNKDIVLREDLKCIFQKFGMVKFIDFKIGEDSGYIRFDDPGAAQKARAAAALTEEGGLIVKNYIATLDPVTGEAEKEYWSLLRSNQDRYRDGKGNRGRGGKFNRGGRQFNGKHSRSRENDSSKRSNKIHKVGSD